MEMDESPFYNAARRSSATDAVKKANKQAQARRTSMFFPSTSGPTDFPRRRSSALLRRSLMHADHSPMSVWPQARTRSDSRFQVTVVPPTEQIGQNRGRVSVSGIRPRPTSRLPSTDEDDIRL